MADHDLGWCQTLFLKAEPTDQKSLEHGAVPDSLTDLGVWVRMGFSGSGAPVPEFENIYHHDHSELKDLQ